jgi:hypothetical protein
VEISVGTQTTQSDSRGFFRIDRLPTGQLAVAARMIGYSTARVPFISTADRTAELRIQLYRSAYTLPEVVVDSRRTGIWGMVLDSTFAPLAGATVQIFGPKRESVLTDSLGGFAFPNAPGGQYMVRAAARGYDERRTMVEFPRGEGRQVGFRLTSLRQILSKDEENALQELGLRLSTGLRNERLTSTELQRYQSGGICDIPRIRDQVGRHSSSLTTLILNGTRVIKSFSVTALCIWRADEVELVEFGSDPCRDPSGSIAFLLGGIWCMGRRQSVPRSLQGTGSGVSGQGSGGSYVVIWEKR